MGHHRFKTVQKHLFEHHTWCRIFLKKVSFSPLLDPVDPFGHPPVWA